MIEVRITSIGKSLPWWRDRVFVAELGGAVGSSQMFRLCRFARELRHAKMLEY